MSGAQYSVNGEGKGLCSEDRGEPSEEVGFHVGLEQSLDIVVDRNYWEQDCKLLAE